MGAMLLLILLAAIGGSPDTTRRFRGANACENQFRWVGYTQTIWQQAGLRYKVKLMVGFYQCLAAVPKRLKCPAPSRARAPQPAGPPS
eukprot:5457103-Prymnesium_polylepis.2